MNLYLQEKRNLEEKMKSFNDVLFWAFSNKQFEEGIEKVKASPENKVVSIGAGGYILKTKVKEYFKMFEDYDEKMKELRKNKEFMIDAFLEELSNHEYIVTYSIEDTLNALDITYEELESSQILKEALTIAKKQYSKKIKIILKLWKRKQHTQDGKKL